MVDVLLFEERTSPVVISKDTALDRNPREELEFSGNEQTEVATDKVKIYPSGGYVWVVCDPD